MKHDKAPTAPYSKGHLIFRKCSYLKNHHFRWPNLADTVKRHICTSRLFIWAFNQVSMTFTSKVLARTNSYFENKIRCCWTFWLNSDTSGGRNCQKGHLHSKTFHLSLYSSLYDLLFITSSPYKRAMTDGRTDGRLDGRTPQLFDRKQE